MKVEKKGKMLFWTARAEKQNVRIVFKYGSMQEISVLFVVLVVLYTVIAVADQISIQCGIYTPLFAATFVGFLLGDLQTGLIIGATLQLMTLGVATYGGATVPDYLSGAIMGTT